MKPRLAALAVLLAATASASAADYRLAPQPLPVLKPVFGQVQSRDVVPARARIGGTVVEIRVDEGDAVTAGDVVATIVDEKLALQREAIDARQAAISAQMENARTNLERAQQLFSRGTIAKTRLDELQTGFDVLANQMAAIEAEKAVIVQQAEEGTVLAPSSGRILEVPVTQGSVILPGEAVASIAGGGYFLRLALPERHAAGIREGDTVTVGARGISPETGAPEHLKGTLAKVYPEIKDGRVIADVEVEGLGDFFVGERTLVSIPIGTRDVLAVPEAAVVTRHGLDYVAIRGADAAIEVTVIPGETFSTGEGLFVEILTGLKTGDVVVVP